MSLIKNHDDDSTIQIKFSESIVQKVATTSDCNRNTSYSSFRRYHSQKRSTSEENHRSIDKEENMYKKQRNDTCCRDFCDNDYNQKFVSLSQSTYSPSIQQNSNDFLCKRSNSILNDRQIHFNWFKEFMRQSLDTIRETVVQACTTVLSAQSRMPLNFNQTTQDVNINNHLIRCSQSENSCASYKPLSRLQPNQLKVASVTQKKDRVSPMYQRFDNDEDDVNRKQRIHHRARTSQYPLYKNVYRALVNDIQVPWSHEWPNYKPTLFTAEEIYINPGADPDLLTSSSSISLHFNVIDGAVDRRSVYQHYHVREMDGLPLNPIGRTGLQGRGSLLRWGPNVYHYVMICRWKQDMNGKIRLHPSNGKRILEILLEIQTDGYKMNNFILTGGLHMIGSRFPPQLQDRLKRFIMHTGSIVKNVKKTSSSLNELNYLFEQIPTPWKGAYFDDARNTDNAWIELSIEYLLDDDHQFTTCIPNIHNEKLKYIEQPRFLWKDITDAIDIGPRTHYRLIKSLAYKLDAYF